jgi:hypothetical protein
MLQGSFVWAEKYFNSFEIKACSNTPNGFMIEELHLPEDSVIF